MAETPAPTGSAPLTTPTPSPVTSTSTTYTNTITTTTTTSTPSVITTNTTTTASSQAPRSAVLEKAQKWIHDVDNLKEKITGVESLADLDEAIDLAQDQNEICDLMLCSMGRKGLPTDTSPKIGVVTPCEEPSHTPKLTEPGKAGMGFFIIPGLKMSAGPWDQIQDQP